MHVPGRGILRQAQSVVDILHALLCEAHRLLGVALQALAHLANVIGGARGARGPGCGPRPPPRRSHSHACPAALNASRLVWLVIPLIRPVMLPISVMRLSNR